MAEGVGFRAVRWLTACRRLVTCWLGRRSIVLRNCAFLYLGGACAVRLWLAVWSFFEGD